MDIKDIHGKVHNGDYLIRSHVVHHALKEGFTRQDMVSAILNGQIIESYSNDKRVFVCGRTERTKTSATYLHIVFDYSDPVYIEFVTAYLSDEAQWERPDFKRRRRRRR
jgi:hypothetical protein